MIDLLVGLICSQALAGEPTAFEREMSYRAGIATRESTEIHDGVEYRKVEVGNETYYFKALEPEGRNVEVICGKPEGFNSGKLVEGSVKTGHRSRVFIEALTETCETHNGQTRRFVNPEFKVGIQFDDSPDSKIKEKKIYMNPLAPTGIGFSGKF